MENLKKSLIDGKTPLNKELFAKIIDGIIAAGQSGGLPYCDFHHNLGAIGGFLAKYNLREVDEFNQLTICMAGDSIFGRQDKGSTWKEDAPEISYTPDMNDPAETRYGYQTGHFPPNMWEKTVPYETLKLLQWDNADVKYFNHSASEVIKEGTWTDGYPLGADNTRAVYTSTVGASAVFTFTGATHLKTVFHYYGAATCKNSLITVEFSTDNGATWKNASQIGVTASMPNAADGDGYYKLPEMQYKWPNICFKGFDKSVTYKVRLTNKSTQRVALWGFETWSKPRINVVVVAEGGNTASSQKNAPQRFYSEMYNPSLVIYELPFLNDLGSGPLAKFKNKIGLTSAAPTSPAEQDFYYCKESGTYTNFGGVVAEQGEYIEWDGSKWKLDSSKLKSVLNTYKADNTAVFERLAQQGVPVIALITHAGIYDTDRPFGREMAIPALRGMVGQYGFAVLDINLYQKIAGFYTTTKSIHSDGTHLNDKGVKMYMDLISLLFTIPLNDQYAGSANAPKRPLFGTGTGGTTVSFGFEFSKIPSVMVSGGTNVAVTEVTKSGFTATGSGTFSYMAQI